MTGKIPPDAFMVYFSLGPDRSYQTVADKYGVTKRAVTKLASKENWQKKAEEIEMKARQAAVQKTVESLEAMNVRHMKSLKVIQGKALETLRNMSLNTAMEAVRALELSIRQERLVRGEPTDRSAVAVEDVIRREYDRWMVNTSEETSSDEENRSDEVDSEKESE